MDILNIPNVPEPNNGNSRIEKNKNSDKLLDSSDSNKSSGLKNGDIISISEAAKKANSLNNFVKTTKELPEIRNELIEKAKNDIATGKLFSQDIAEATAEEILRRF